MKISMKLISVLSILPLIFCIETPEEKGPELQKKSALFSSLFGYNPFSSPTSAAAEAAADAAAAESARQAAASRYSSYKRSASFSSNYF